MMKKVIMIAVLCFAMLLCSCGASPDNSIQGWEPADQQAKAAVEVLGGTSAEGFLDSPEALEQNEHTWLVYCVFSGQWEEK